MTVSGVNSIGAAATNSAASKSTVDYESFLRLLVAQLKFQDPTQPMDSTQYMAQLASFSQVEQSVQMNSKLDSLLQFSQLSQAGNLIGKVVTSGDESVTGTVMEVRLTSEGIVAVLDNGSQLLIGEGVTISNPEAVDA
jgi:flagellar basal-body rod modification protein FlgD